MQAMEIEEHARRMMAAMGPKAIAEAAAKARALEDKGASEDARDWRRIEAALTQMAGPRAT